MEYHGMAVHRSLFKHVVYNFPLCVQVYDGPSTYSCLSLIPNTTLFALVYEKGKISAYESISLARLKGL